MPANPAEVACSNQSRAGSQCRSLRRWLAFLESIVRAFERDKINCNTSAKSRLVNKLLKGRYSARYFLPDKVSRATIEDIVDAANNAPSGSNMHLLHLWRHQRHDIHGNLMVDAHKSGAPYVARYAYWPPTLPADHAARKFEFEKRFYAAFGVEWGDMEGSLGRAAIAGRNYEFFNAPIALIFTINSELRQGSWMDLGHLGLLGLKLYTVLETGRTTVWHAFKFSRRVAAFLEVMFLLNWIKSAALLASEYQVGKARWRCWSSDDVFEVMKGCWYAVVRAWLRTARRWMVPHLQRFETFVRDVEPESSKAWWWMVHVGKKFVLTEMVQSWQKSTVESKKEYQDCTSVGFGPWTSESGLGGMTQFLNESNGGGGVGEGAVQQGQIRSWFLRSPMSPAFCLCALFAAAGSDGDEAGT
ncbi:hypothetical protein C8R47DRAFT_1069963 [Mycena vitilis]|nr:hypothetical protein C8R47DRAFT_1069963 [Mycena vitilis]